MRPILALVLFSATVALAAERSFHFEYAVNVRDLPAGVRQVDIWLPVPHDDAFQRITNFQVETAWHYEIGTAEEGNRILHMRAAKPRNPAVPVIVRFDAVRQEHIQPLPAASTLTGGRLPAGVERYLKPDRLVPLDDRIRRWAREVVETAGAKSDLEMARAIYDHVVATVKYDTSGKGVGHGDTYYACDARRGDSTDFHAIFIGYARAMGIPARFAIGFPLPADRGKGALPGYHCWAEFYAKGIGWVPVDVSEAARNPDKREYFFGAHDENRLEFSKGRDVLLVPKQQGPSLNYFVYPYVEVDGARYGAIETVYTYQDLPL